MSILAITTTLTAETDVTDLNELAERLDAVHDSLTGNASVMSADLVTDGGHAIHAFVNFISEAGEQPEDTAARGEAIMQEAFKIGKIATKDSGNGAASIAMSRRAFALA